jgi:release factor glutamine methyltransferase
MSQAGTGGQGATLRQAQQAVQALGIDRLEAQTLLLHVLRRPLHDRAWLLAHDGDPMRADVLDGLLALGARRAAGEPVGYLTGWQAFYGLELAVDPRVLVPRPDTETLVDWALAIMEPLSAPTVLDLGTGSGAIALALQQQRPDARVLAVDASADALAVARANASRLGLPVEVLQSDWFGSVQGRFDLIVSNPPYIAEGDAHLPGLRHEPRSALASGTDGLDDLRRIVAGARSHLAPGGWLLMEHGWDQASAVRDLLAARHYEQVASRKDLAAIERCSGGKSPAGG